MSDDVEEKVGQKARVSLEETRHEGQNRIVEVDVLTSFFVWRVRNEAKQNVDIEPCMLSLCGIGGLQ